jgi:hypothetical protein
MNCKRVLIWRFETSEIEGRGQEFRGEVEEAREQQASTRQGLARERTETLATSRSCSTRCVATSRTVSVLLALGIVQMLEACTCGSQMISRNYKGLYSGIQSASTVTTCRNSHLLLYTAQCPLVFRAMQSSVQ